MPVLPGGLQVCPVVVPPLVGGGDDPLDLDVPEPPPLAPAKPGIFSGMQSDGRSLVTSKRVVDHLGLLSSSPRFASMERDTEMSAEFVSFTPVLDAPVVWLQTPFGSFRSD